MLNIRVVAPFFILLFVNAMFGAVFVFSQSNSRSVVDILTKMEQGTSYSNIYHLIGSLNLSNEEMESVEAALSQDDNFIHFRQWLPYFVALRYKGQKEQVVTRLKEYFDRDETLITDDVINFKVFCLSVCNKMLYPGAFQENEGFKDLFLEKIGKEIIKKEIYGLDYWVKRFDLPSRELVNLNNLTGAQKEKAKRENDLFNAAESGAGNCIYIISHLYRLTGDDVYRNIIVDLSDHADTEELKVIAKCTLSPSFDERWNEEKRKEYLSCFGSDR